MNTQEVVNQMNVVLDALAARFGATGEALWLALVQYQVAEAAAMLLIPAVVMLLAVVPALAAWRRMLTPPGDDPSYNTLRAINSHNEILWIVIAISGVIFIIALFALCVVAAEAVPSLMSPEAAVLKSLLP